MLLQVGTAIPAFGDTGVANAITTALIWGEASTLITCADVIITNTLSCESNHSYGPNETFNSRNGEIGKIKLY